MHGLLKGLTVSILMILLVGVSSFAQYSIREDVIWARNLNGATITLDGALNEAIWAQAESLTVAYGVNNGLPTSGWRAEFQPEAIKDPTNAVVKFLSDGHQLYLGFIIPDSSIGGNAEWARWDGILMSIKDRASESRPTPALEFFYTWWYVNIPGLVVPGAPPRFVGAYGNHNDTTRTLKQKTVWDARSVIVGQSNDSLPDEAWIVEMRVCVDSLGYQAYQTGGDVVELNFSIWDCDHLFAGDPLKTSTTRSDWQSPWGNANDHNVGRIHIDPDVTINTPVLPQVPPDVILKNGANFPDPVIDGILNEEVWGGAYSFRIKWDDLAVYATYPGVGPYRSGQFQPELISGSRPPVIDPGDCQVKMFFKGDFLYVAANVNDQLVQGVTDENRYDAIKVMVGDRVALDSDARMIFRMLTVTFDINGSVIATNYLPTMVDSSLTEYAASLKGATTVNQNSDMDEGFFVEMKIDLTYLGYPSGLGDKLLFMGVCLFDGDSFDDQQLNYGTRTWWFRENADKTSTPWAVMDPNLMVGINDQPIAHIPASIEISGNYPNPFNPVTSIRYSLPFTGQVELTVFNLLGQEISRINAGLKSAGNHELNFSEKFLSSGIYFYRLTLTNPATGNVQNSDVKKMVLIK